MKLAASIWTVAIALCLSGAGAFADELTAPGSPARNPGFDITPARLVTGLITERGVTPATRDGLRALFPERAR